MYELGSIPFPLFDENWDMQKGNKSMFMNNLTVFMEDKSIPDVPIADRN
jgi:hypothetical protein